MNAYQPPTSQDEYNERYLKNLRVEGFGSEVTNVFACPFCAAPDWQRVRITHTHEDMRRESKCKACGRSAVALFTYQPTGMSLRYVQTGGDDAPEWLTGVAERWGGCPAARLIDKRTNQDIIYLESGSGPFYQLVCTRRHHDNHNHSWANQNSEAGKNAREHGKFTD